MNEFQRLCEDVFEKTWNSHIQDKFCKIANYYCKLNNCEECMKELHLTVDITAKTPEGEKSIDKAIADKEIEALNEEDENIKIVSSYTCK